MLKQRIITAALLIPIVVGLLFYVSPPVFAILSGFVVLMAFMEWMAMMQLRSLAARLFYLFVMVTLMITSGMAFMALGNQAVPVAFSIFLLAVIWWLIAIVLVLVYPRGAACWSQNKLITSVMGILIFLPCWLAMFFIRVVPLGSMIILYVFVLIWGADTTAYFVGKYWGKTKLLPQVSPGKTWEGVLGALAFTLVISTTIGLLTNASYAITAVAIAYSLVTVIFSIFGDLFESAMKRQAGCKDSGNLLPGHGGMYDRIDSLTAAMPVYAFLWLLTSLMFAAK